MKKKSILLSSIFLSTAIIVSCGGGGGGGEEGVSETGGVTAGGSGGAITNKQQALNVTTNALDYVVLSTGIVNTASSELNPQSVSLSPKEGKGGLLRLTLKLYKREKSNRGRLKPQEVYQDTCDNGGSITITASKSGDFVRADINFNNCRIGCETVGGKVTISGTDNNANGIPESADIFLYKGLTYDNSCEELSIYYNGNVKVHLVGKLPNGDMMDSNDKIKVSMTVNGGPVKAVTYQGKWVEGSFNNLVIYYNEYNPGNADYEIKISGNLNYRDNYCIIQPTAFRVETPVAIKGFSSVYCPYQGKINISNVTGEYYDPDRNPFTENYLRITLDGQTIFDDVCTNLEIPDSC